MNPKLGFKLANNDRGNIILAINQFMICGDISLSKANKRKYFN